MKKFLTVKWIVIISVAVVLVVACGVRFYFVNKDVDKPIIQVFEKGEQVGVEKDFFDSSDENGDGYTFTVLDAELLPLDDFLQKYKATEEDRELMGMYTDYIYTVRVSVANHNNSMGEQAGVNLRRCVLQGTDYYLMADDICFNIANPNMPGLGFSLRENSSLEIVIPYGIMSNRVVSIKHLEYDQPKLLISLYPHEKLLKIY
jgi:hypothetical protein